MYPIEEKQRALCREHSVNFVAAPPESKLGFALSTRGQLPINGLRHPASGDTNGWYIWCGEEFSGATDFFAALHTKHIYDDLPQVANLLGLPPGSRFLLNGSYLDVWSDSCLLNR